MSATFEVFIHAPFVDDCAAARNETSLELQVTLRDPSGADGRVLLFGDLAHDTIMKIFDYSEAHQREDRLAWDMLLAPHHCSKYVMYSDGELQSDVLDAFGRHAREHAVVVASSPPIPTRNNVGDNPPHAKAKARYLQILDGADQFICTQEWPDPDHPSPPLARAFPARHRLEADETPEECVARELEEETGLHVLVGPVIRNWVFEVLPGRHVLVLAYGCHLVTEDIEPTVSHEHSAVQFVPVAEIPGLSLPAGYQAAIADWLQR
ncbi:MAG: NUDIX hydrolase [Actinomycetota bacterium]|nr:NUDIX hydrolase [Actinomycetota bacterium]